MHIGYGQIVSVLKGGGNLTSLSGRAARQVIGIVIAQLQEALHARGGVVRALPLEAMRQLQHQPRALAPPLLACSHDMHALMHSLEDAGALGMHRPLEGSEAGWQYDPWASPVLMFIRISCSNESRRKDGPSPGVQLTLESKVPAEMN